jgi:hypothetical protein
MYLCSDVLKYVQLMTSSPPLNSMAKIKVDDKSARISPFPPEVRISNVSVMEEGSTGTEAKVR